LLVGDESSISWMTIKCCRITFMLRMLVELFAKLRLELGFFERFPFLQFFNCPEKVGKLEKFATFPAHKRIKQFQVCFDLHIKIAENLCET
jgi:hypothetical protein